MTQLEHFSSMNEALRFNSQNSKKGGERGIIMLLWFVLRIKSGDV